MSATETETTSKPATDSSFSSDPPITPVHQWTHTSTKVRMIKCVDKDGRGYNGFQWPEKGSCQCPVAAKDPIAARALTCESGGLFGWPWGIGLGSGKEPEYGGRWIVFECDPADVIYFDGRIKCVGVVDVIFSGPWWAAWAMILDGAVTWTQHASRGASSATGDSSASSATGYSSASSATGDSSASSATGYSSASSATGCSSASSATGDSSASSATGYSSASSATGSSSASSATGYSSASSATGDKSASSATGYSSASSATGYSSASSATGYNSASSATGDKSASSATGDSSAALSIGINGSSTVSGVNAMAIAERVRGDADAVLVAREFIDGKLRVVVGYIGEDGIKANTWYRALGGKLVQDE